MSVFGSRSALDKAWSAALNVAGVHENSDCHEARSDGLTLVERMLEKMKEEASDGGDAVDIIQGKLRAYGSHARLSTTDPADRGCFKSGGKDILEHMLKLALLLSKNEDFDSEEFFDMHLDVYMYFLRERTRLPLSEFKMSEAQYIEALCVREYMKRGELAAEQATALFPFHRKLSLMHGHWVREERAVPQLSRRPLDREGAPEPSPAPMRHTKRGPEEIRGLKGPREWPGRG